MTLIHLKDQSQSSPNTYISIYPISIHIIHKLIPYYPWKLSCFFLKKRQVPPPQDPLRGVPCTETPNSRGCCESRVEPVEPSQPTARVSQMMWIKTLRKTNNSLPLNKKAGHQKERIVFQTWGGGMSF